MPVQQPSKRSIHIPTAHSDPAMNQGRRLSTPISGRIGTGLASGSSSRSRHRPISRPNSRFSTRAVLSSPCLLGPRRERRLSQRPSSMQPPSYTHAGNDQEGSHDEFAEDSITPEIADALNEVIMAVDMKDNGNLGCAYYIAADESLFLLEDITLAEISIVETLLLHARPTTILTSARACTNLVEHLERGAQGNEEQAGTESYGSYVFRTLNSADFRYEDGKESLLALNFKTAGQQSILYTSIVDEPADEGEGPDNNGEGSKQGRLMNLGSLVNLDSQLTVGCCGALLGDLQRRKSAYNLPNDPDSLMAFRVSSIGMFCLFDSMFINADTLVSLQIIQSEFHPNSHQRGPTGANSGAKESLSVFGLFQNLAHTPQGRFKLRRMFLRPSMDLSTILERQKTVTFFSRHESAEVVGRMAQCLRRVSNMKRTMHMLRKGVDNTGPNVSVSRNAWAVVQRFAASCLQIREFLKAMPGAENIPLVIKVLETIDTNQMCSVGEMITQTIDFEQSRERGRTAVKQGVDSELDELKRRYDGMEYFLSVVIAKLRAHIPDWAKQYVQNCIFYPQLGFLTAVVVDPDTGQGKYNGEGLNDSWERMFAAEGCIYYKNRQMKEMDAQFGDAYCMIIDREIELIYRLTAQVLERDEIIIAESEILGDLDSFLALGIGCSQYGWVCPEITTDNVIHISGGYHPLQELVVPSFIANDCHISGGEGNVSDDVTGAAQPSGTIDSDMVGAPSTVILTGPNHSGKSVYLKQIAVIVFLAHIGCFVPAAYARIGLTDRILTRIATRESVARNESAFSIDLRQVAFAINFATRRSLVLIDEFGKGTNSNDGAGLMAALMQHFTQMGNGRPKLLAATHFHELIESGFLVESEELTFKHMEIRVDFNAPTADDQVAFLFQLAPGASASSFGTRCAFVNGVDESVVQRADSITLLLSRNEDLVVACSKLSDGEVKRLEEAEAAARNFLQEDIAPVKPGEVGGHQFREILDDILGDSGDSTTSDGT